MKKLQAVIFASLLLLVIVGTIYGTSTLSRSALNDREENVTCDTPGANHVTTIQAGALSVSSIQARPCDTLTIVNTDDQLRLMAFGIHEKHQTYAGVTEETLKPGERMTVTLEELGTFTFHDHLHDEVKGTFTVR